MEAAAKVFMAGLLLVALAAALEAAPKLVLLGGGPGLERPGSFLDNGSLGLSEAGKALAGAGYRLLQGLGPVKGVGSVVYLVAGPMSCGADEARVLVDAIREQARYSRVGVVVAAGGEYSSCGRLVVEGLGVEAPLYLESLTGVYLVAGTPLDPSVLWALYSPDRVDPVGGWAVLSWAVGREGDRVPAVLSVDAEGVRIVYVPSWNAFSNSMVRAEREAGLEPDKAIVGLFDYASGMERGAVVLPSQFLPVLNGSAAAMLAFHPATLMLRAAEAYSRLEQAMYTRLSRSPLLVALAAWVLTGLMLVPLHFGVGSVAGRVREKPRVRLEAREALPGEELGSLEDVREALELVLLEKTGVGLEEAAERPPGALVRAARRLGMSVDELVALLRMLSTGRLGLFGRRRLRKARELVDILVFVEE